jgi:hypothetical protein
MNLMNTVAASAEDLPALYRSVLALVGELERCGGRPEARLIRKRALAVYAGAWDERHRQVLEDLEHRLLRSIATHRQPAR